MVSTRPPGWPGEQFSLFVFTWRVSAAVRCCRALGHPHSGAGRHDLSGSPGSHKLFFSCLKNVPHFLQYMKCSCFLSRAGGQTSNGASVKPGADPRALTQQFAERLSRTRVAYGPAGVGWHTSRGVPRCAVTSQRSRVCVALLMQPRAAAAADLRSPASPIHPNPPFCRSCTGSPRW